MKTQVSRADYIETNMHVSHLFSYVSPYERTKEAVDGFVELVNFMSKKARENDRTEYMCFGGMMDMVFYPNGNFALVLVHQVFTFDESEAETPSA